MTEGNGASFPVGERDERSGSLRGKKTRDPGENSGPSVAGDAGAEATDPAAMVKAIRRIVRAIEIHSKAVAKATGLTIPQIILLQAIRELGEVTTNRLSAHADLSAATVVTILDKLEAKGLVERYRSTIDRRVVHSRLTGAGRRTLDSSPSLLQDAFVAAFSALGTDERGQILRAFTRVATMMDARDLDAGPVLITGEV